MDKTYEEEMMEIMDRNESIQSSVKEDFKSYALAFRNRGIETTFAAAPMVPYPNLHLKDMESGEEIEIVNLHNKEDFIEKFPQAMKNWRDGFFEKEGHESPFTYSELDDYFSLVQERFTNAFQQITDRDRESSFIFSFDAKEDTTVSKNPSVDAIIEAIVLEDTQKLAVISDKLYDAFMKNPDVGLQWEEKSSDLGDSATKLFGKPTAEIIRFENPYSGEYVSFLGSVDRDKHGSLVVAGEVTDKTATMLDNYCKTALKNTGFYIDNFKEKFEKDVVNRSNSIVRPKINLKFRSNSHEKSDNELGK